MYKRNLKIAFTLMIIAIALGAFGAHGLEGKVSAKALKTFKTGNFYHFIHSLALILFVIIEKIFSLNFTKARVLTYVGLIFFSIFCYIYALTSLKVFAMLVPIGGISFIASWTMALFSLRKEVFNSRQ